MQPSCSLVIATYNWPGALSLCLETVFKQSVLPAEIIIADDGSGSATKKLVETLSNRSPVPLLHIWQKDDGFRLAAIRNKANAAAKYDYIIQIDGDLLLHHDFIKDHLDAAKQAQFIGGSRCLLDRNLSEKLISLPSTVVRLTEKGVSNKFNGLHVSFLGKMISRFFFMKSVYHIRGCNMSYWKKDFIAINGYDEAYTGWGREDTDLVLRFMNIGLLRPSFKLRGVAFHLWHPEADRSALLGNDALLQEKMAAKSTRCKQGINQYLLHR